MLPITSKHLTVQIITTTSVLITFMLLSSFYQTTDCLPITSKPIESTVENLAWEAWLMVPVGQQQKSRKVTAKSIFIVPQKKNQSSAVQCPPGEHLFESRCIPTVNIDTEKLLIEQLTNFVVSSGGVYDYDYDDDISDPIGAEKLEGGGDISSSSDNADAPLKFDIFRDNFPIGSPGSGDSSGNRDSEDDNILFIGERRRRPPMPEEGDLDTQSSSYGAHHNAGDEGADDQSTLFLSGIDAILVPAVSGIQEKDKNLNFSIYQDVANATTVSTDVEILTPVAKKVADLEQILKKDSLFLDKDHELDGEGATTTEKSESTTDQVETETTTMKLEDDEDVEGKTEFVRSITEPEEQSTSTSTDSTEETSTLTSDETETTTMEPSEEATTATTVDDETTMTDVASGDTTTKEEEFTTMTSSSAKVDEKEAAIESFAELTPLPGASRNRFVYEHHSETKRPPPPVVDISAELKIINDLVARNRKLLSTTTSSVDSTSKSSPQPTAAIASSSSSSSSSTESSADDISSSSPASSTAEAPAMGKTDPFWWLPTGWRVDRTDADRPLLLRFWSALTSASGSQTKV